MKKELQEELFAIAPEWFRRDDIKSSLMCFGFEVGDGWFDLLKELILQIKEEKPAPDFEVAQVKEKFGGLRFYAHGGSDKINAIITFAENLSYKICETCGGRGEANKQGWISVLCATCRAEKALIIG